MKVTSKKYTDLIKILDDDETYIYFFNLMPFQLLSYFVPKYYLVERYEYLVKMGKLKKQPKKKGSNKNE